jgi:hypothetical protein
MGESEQKSGSSFGFWEMAILILIIGFVVAVAIPNRISDGHNSPTLRCVNNLRQIDSAINEWALVKGETNGSVIIENDIKPYITLDVKGNLPKCPSGGKYIFGKVGDNPQVSCSFSSVDPYHKLP